MARKLHYTGIDDGTVKRASCGYWVQPGEPRVTTPEEFWRAGADLCRRCERAATNEASPF